MSETLFPSRLGPPEETNDFFGDDFRPNETISTDARLTIGLNEQLAAHLVTPRVSRTRPQLRALFYAGHADQAAVCVVLGATGPEKQKLFSACSPGNSRDGACVAELKLPPSWWPPEDGESPKKRRKPGLVKVRGLIESNWTE